MRIVASLTSTPPRVGKVERTVRSLLMQTHRLDAVYVWLPRRLARTGAVLRNWRVRRLRRLEREDPRVRIAILKEDRGPATKLVPALAAEIDPETRIFYCDDDILYGPTIIAGLLEASSAWPDAALSVTSFALDHNRTCETSGGRHYHPFVPTGNHGQATEIIEGFGGVLVQRRFFGSGFASLFPPLDEARDFSGRRERGFLLPSFSDDLVISRYLTARGIPLKNVQAPGCNRDVLTILKYGLRRDALQRISADGGPFGNLVRYSHLWPEVTELAARTVAGETRPIG